MPTIVRLSKSSWTVFVVLLIGFLLIGTGKTQAGPITFAFVGTVTNVQPGLSGAFNLGDIMSGSYTFESTTPDTFSSSSFGAYEEAIVALSFSLSGYQGSFGGTPDNRIVLDTRSGQYAAFVSFAGPSINGFAPHDFALFLSDRGLTALTSDALLLTPPELSEFELRDLSLSFVVASQIT